MSSNRQPQITNARWYDAALGRFVSADSLVPSEVQGLNRYAYVVNNPLRFVDPSGNKFCDEVDGNGNCIQYPGSLVGGGSGQIGASGDSQSYCEKRPESPQCSVRSGGNGRNGGNGGNSGNGTSDPNGGNDGNTQGECDSSSPWEVGWEWLTGTGPRNHNFCAADPFTGLLRQHSHIDSIRACIANSPSDISVCAQNYYLGGLAGVPKYLKDYSTLLTFSQTGNLAVTYLGSYNVELETINVDQNSISVKFRIDNTSDLNSGLHPPILGYELLWDATMKPILLAIAGDSGPMSPTTQTFTWMETIPLP